MDRELLNSQLERTDSNAYNKSCPRCATIINSSEDEINCPRCTGLNNPELIDLHIKQAEEQYFGTALGKKMLVVSLIMVVLAVFWLVIDNAI